MDLQGGSCPPNFYLLTLIIHVKMNCFFVQKPLIDEMYISDYKINLIFSDLPSPSPLPQLYQQHTAVSDWPEQVEFHPYSVEEESELGYMDDPYHEDLLAPSFFSLERDALQIVEVTFTFLSVKLHDTNKSKIWLCAVFCTINFLWTALLLSQLLVVLEMMSLITPLLGWRRTQSDGEV